MPAWAEADQQDFEEKLRRARPGSRAQYIRLKALALAASTRRSEKEAAPALLGLYATMPTTSPRRLWPSRT